jgi:hypothetical protein
MSQQNNPFTDQELAVWRTVIDAAAKYIKLVTTEAIHADEPREVTQAFHVIQGWLEHRGFKRAFPDLYNGALTMHTDALGNYAKPTVEDECCGRCDGVHDICINDR